MGAGQSSSQHETPSRALHVLRVTPHSPASKTNIEPFFDFVVGFEGDVLSHASSIDVSQLERIVEQHEDRVLELLVWSSKSQKTRVVPVKPSRAWSQTSEPKLSSNGSDPQPSLLGLSMRMCEPETAKDNVWHVLDVVEGSPAESAGLVPMGDWILGWSGGALGAENDFYDLVEAHADKPLRVFVYSYDFDALREVVLIPNRHWGGEGLLGCVFGFGLLHRIPPQPEDRRPGSMPVELLQEATDEYEEPELFVPADVSFETQPNSEKPELEGYRHDQQVHWNDPNDVTRSLYDNQRRSAHVPSSQQYYSHRQDLQLDHESDDEKYSSSRPRTESSLPSSYIDNSEMPTRSFARPLMNNGDS